jgi:hypothetical protein
MDPDECFKRWAVASASGDDEEAAESWRDLAGWLRGGGFAPAWTAAQEHAFRCWAPLLVDGSGGKVIVRRSR